MSLNHWDANPKCLDLFFWGCLKPSEMTGLLGLDVRASEGKIGF